MAKTILSSFVCLVSVGFICAVPRPVLAVDRLKAAVVHYEFGPGVLPTDQQVIDAANLKSNELRTQYGPGDPRVVLILNNGTATDKVITAVKAVFGSIPVYAGAGTGPTDVAPNDTYPYAAWGIDSFSDMYIRSVSLLALGGPAVSLVESVDDNGKYDWGESCSSITEGGVIMANKIHLNPQLPQWGTGGLANIFSYSSLISGLFK